MRHDDDAHLVPVDSEGIYAITRPTSGLLTLYIIYSALSTVLFPIVFAPLYFRYITLRYRFDDAGVAVSYGILWRRETYLTYSRIQDIHVTRNIIERWLGLGTVKIQTASGSSNAEEAIVGVTTYNEIRNFLYAHMRGHTTALKAAPAEGADSGTSADVLRGIRDELAAIRQLVEANNHV